MKVFNCDICGKEVGEYNLRTMYEKIQQKDIKDMCDECNDEITNANRKIKDALEKVRVSWLQKVINKVVERKR